MIDADERTEHFYDNFAGTENDLNHVLSTFVDSEHEITNFCHSRYADLSEVQSIFQNNPNEFLILTLNIQSVNAKFNNLFPVIDNLASQGLYFGAICLQETWTSTDSDLLHYYNSLDTNSFTREINVLSMVGWWYSWMIVTVIKYESYSPTPTSGKAYLSTSVEATFAVHSQLVTYTDLLTITIKMQIYNNSYRRSLL